MPPAVDEVRMARLACFLNIAASLWEDCVRHTRSLRGRQSPSHNTTRLLTLMRHLRRAMTIDGRVGDIHRLQRAVRHAHRYTDSYDSMSTTMREYEDVMGTGDPVGYRILLMLLAIDRMYYFWFKARRWTSRNPALDRFRHLMIHSRVCFRIIRGQSAALDNPHELDNVMLPYI